MLKYVATTHTHAPTTGEKVPLTRLDQDESPARSLLLRIPNVHLRNVRYYYSCIFLFCFVLIFSSLSEKYDSHEISFWLALMQ